VTRVSGSSGSRQDSSRARQDPVHSASGPFPRTHTPVRPPEGPAAGVRGVSMADVLYALLLLGGFAVLALCLRGLERL
jgi:hypothetical protein